MEDMLEFLEHTFEGGTDLQAPLHLSLERLQKHDWSLVRTTASVSVQSRAAYLERSNDLASCIC